MFPCVRLVVLTVAICGVTVATLEEGFQCNGSHGHDVECIKKWHDEFFDDLSNQQIWLESNLNSSCFRLTGSRFKEVLETGRYKLTRQLKNYKRNDFDIKIKSNILYFILRKSNEFEAEIVILPRFVTTAEAAYLYDGNILDIVFPIITLTNACDSGFDNFTAIVPEFGTRLAASAANRRHKYENIDYFSRIKEWYDKTFESLCEHAIRLDAYLKNACLKHSNGRLREVIVTGGYKLTTELSGYSIGDFDIKIRSNVLYFSARNSRTFNAEVMILPRFVDVKNALYLYDGRTFDIVFPVNTGMAVCDRVSGSVLISVPAWILNAEGSVMNTTLRTPNINENNSYFNVTERAPTAAPTIPPEESFPCKTRNGQPVDFDCIKQWHDELFKNLSTNQVWLGENLKSACLNGANQRLREVIENDSYKLTIQLTCSKDEFDIKIKNNVLYLDTKDTRHFNLDLVILPQFVETTQASYFYYNNTLDIMFPIINQNDSCERGYSNIDMTVPKFKILWGAEILKRVRRPVVPTPLDNKNYLYGSYSNSDRTALYKEKFPCQYGVDYDCMKRWHDTFFETLSRNQLWLESELKDSCQRHSKHRFREIIQMGRYKLTTQLNGFSKEDFEIKIRSNVLYLSARNNRAFHAELAVLPRFVNTAKASYFYDGQSLDIVFPIVPVASNDCDHSRIDVFMIVRQSEPVSGLETQTDQGRKLEVAPDMQNRFQDNNFHDPLFGERVPFSPQEMPCDTSGSDFNCLKRWHDQYFEMLSRYQTMVAKVRGDACSSNSEFGLREVLEKYRYKLTTPLIGYSKEYLEIKIRSKLLYFSAKNKDSYNVDFKMLPQFVDETKAWYAYNGFTLDIIMPINRKGSACAHSFVDDVITVPDLNEKIRSIQRNTQKTQRY